LVAKCAAIITLNTTMRGGELKTLHWADGNLADKLVTVRKSKTAAGLRVIPINAHAFAAFAELLKRSQAFNGTDPSHYVFPACEHGDVDPTVPMHSWRTAWRGLTKAAGLPGLRFHDLRHHAVTELAESQTSEQTILSIAGHVSRKMLEHYSHVRIEAKRTALDELALGAVSAVEQKRVQGVIQGKHAPISANESDTSTQASGSGDAQQYKLRYKSGLEGREGTAND
jgi:integrase